MADDERDDPAMAGDLERIRRATASLVPDDALVDEVMLRVLGAATRDVTPAPELADAVLARIGEAAVAGAAVTRTARDESVAEGVTRRGPWAVAFAAVAAAACALFSVEVQEDVDLAVVTVLDANLESE